MKIFDYIIDHLPTSKHVQKKMYDDVCEKLFRISDDICAINKQIAALERQLVQARTEMLDGCLSELSRQIDGLEKNIDNCSLHFFETTVKENEHIDLMFNRTRSDIKYLRDMKLNCQMQPGIQYFILNIADHCNLNCKGCNHFSCIAQERFVNKEIIKNDLSQMSHVHGNIPRIGIMGGEPLLHPELLDILVIVRHYFPESELLLSTNGILLNSMQQKFWDLCRDYNITLRVTKYPINIDYNSLSIKAVTNCVNIEFFLGGNKREKMKSVSFDIAGHQNPNYSFGGCLYANNCVFLDSGKLYTCEVVATSRIFAKKFGVKMPLEKGDYIDIYSSSKEDTLKYLSSPIPFCRFCDVNKRKYNDFEWSITAEKIDEWL